MFFLHTFLFIRIIIICLGKRKKEDSIEDLMKELEEVNSRINTAIEQQNQMIDKILDLIQKI